MKTQETVIIAASTSGRENQKQRWKEGLWQRPYIAATALGAFGGLARRGQMYQNSLPLTSSSVPRLGTAGNPPRDKERHAIERKKPRGMEKD